MKNFKERQETLIKEFNISDPDGTVHKAIIVGVLEVESWEDIDAVEKSRIEGKKTIYTVVETEVKRVYKVLNIGLAITNPTDTYNYDLGVMIAKGRALKEKKRLGTIHSTTRGMLGPEMISVILDQQIKFIRENTNLFCKVSVPKKDDLPF